MKSDQCGVAAVALALFLAGCAAPPENIKPLYVSDAQFSYLNCNQLADYERTLLYAYYAAAGSENDARDIDAATTILVGVPIGSMTHETVPYQIADLKGRIAAVGRLQVQHNCLVRSASAGK